MVIAARSEYEDQVAVFQWAAINEYRWPCLKLLYGSLMGIHVPIKLLNKAKKAGGKNALPKSAGKSRGL